jgi:hypothetical protein
MHALNSLCSAQRMYGGDCNHQTTQDRTNRTTKKSQVISTLKMQGDMMQMQMQIEHKLMQI